MKSRLKSIGAEDYNKYIYEVETELTNNSDRGIVLVCASVIEELLENLIKKVLKDSPTIEKDLFKGNAPLSNFDAKLKLSFYLGLITEEEKRNISIMQRIRNKFAHQVIDISFNNIDIKNLSSNFSLAENSYFPALFSRNISIKKLNPISKNTSPKKKFLLIFRHLITSLFYRDRLYKEIFHSRKILVAKPITELALLFYEQTETNNKRVIEQTISVIEKSENEYKGIESEVNSEKKLYLERNINQMKRELDIFQSNPFPKILKNNYEFIKKLYSKV